MQKLIDKYAGKLCSCGLCDESGILFAGLDDGIFWSGSRPEKSVLEELLRGGGANTMLLARPREPYASILDFLAERAGDCIIPGDCETRTFLHALPVVREFSAPAIGAALAKRKCAVIPGKGVVTYGTVSPEQAFVVFSSVCFAGFVNFFSGLLQDARNGVSDPERERVFELARTLLEELPASPPELLRGPFATPEQSVRAICEAGRKTVEYGLVDSFFGNVSCLHEGVLHISQTGSSLDEMEGCVDPCPLDSSSCAGITASSELSAHRRVVESGFKAVLHGHPKFSVILSLDCEKSNCPGVRGCHLDCPEKRAVCGVPIVPGEVGTGPTGLCNTMPPALKNSRGVIVYGHGVFCADATDFNRPFANLLAIERECRAEFFARLRRLRGG